MKFDQFEPGQTITAGPYEVTESEIIEFARQYDPQWFHTDPAKASDSRFGGLIASGWHTCGIAMRLAVEAALDSSESFASPGLEYIKWPAPVYPGDRLRLSATVLETRRASKSPWLGILRWRWHLHNQDGVEVLELEATSLFDLGTEPAT
ncbi:MAG: MaoC family dehydratase [Gammaproteobacteria bacterium]|nr:MAG: MaoC family dehydratase [Gammaproteobacteria bacterium]UCH38927.1 MAG: MaoC family dehydratase [Gammaproteobacteria bacterium]